MHKFDISAIILFVLITSTFLYFNIKSNIDDDINNKIKYILTDKSDQSDKSQDTKSKENFIVSDAQDFHNYDKTRGEIKKEDDNFNKDRLLHPPEADKIDYDKEIDKSKYSITVVHGEPKFIPSKKEKRSYITANDFGWDAPFPSVSCSNSSIDERYKSGPKRLLPMQVSCGYPNGLTAENYYRTHYMAQAVKIDDYPIRGWNYNTFTDFIHPTKSNIRILSQNTKGLPPEQTKYRYIPSGSNYAFHNTPAMSLP